MSSAPVVVVVGAGSPRFTPGFLAAVAARASLHGTEIRLVDTSTGRLERMLGWARRFLAGCGNPCRVGACDDVGTALEGSDFVVATVAVGGERARSLDLEIPRRHGVVHVAGDTTGPAGIFRGLRHIPFVVDMCRQMERRCPRALLVNLSNPLSVITRAALRETSIVALGICSAIEDMKADISGKLGKDPARFQLDCLGVNHFTWMMGLFEAGRDAGEEFRARALPVFLSDLPVSGDLYRRYGCFPVPGYKYGSEFFPHYLGPDTHHGRDLGLVAPDPEARQADADRRSAQLDREPLFPPVPDSLAAAVADTLGSMVDGRLSVQNLDLPNQGRIPELPFEAVVEGPVAVAGRSLRPLCCGRLPPAVTTLLVRVTAEQELVVEAGVKGSRVALREAFRLDPLVGDPATADAIIDEMLRAEAEWLPQFGSRP